MITASALARHCAYAKILGAQRTRTPEQQTAIDRGTEFHAAIERWIVEGELPTVTDLEIMGWVDLLASQWRPPDGARAEMVWGLSPAGDYVSVTEPRPHEYVPERAEPLLTAGRADCAWIVYAADLLVVVDWKAGKWPVTPARDNLQCNAAGRALARRWGCGAYVPAVYYARDGVWDWGDRVVIGAPADAAMLAEIVAAATLPPTPMPGEWCSACWERRNCASAQSP